MFKSWPLLPCKSTQHDRVKTGSNSNHHDRITFSRTTKQRSGHDSRYLISMKNIWCREAKASSSSKTTSLWFDSYSQHRHIRIPGTGLGLAPCFASNGRRLVHEYSRIPFSFSRSPFGIRKCTCPAMRPAHAIPFGLETNAKYDVDDREKQSCNASLYSATVGETITKHILQTTSQGSTICFRGPHSSFQEPRDTKPKTYTQSFRENKLDSYRNPDARGIDFHFGHSGRSVAIDIPAPTYSPTQARLPLENEPVALCVNCDSLQNFCLSSAL